MLCGLPVPVAVHHNLRRVDAAVSDPYFDLPWWQRIPWHRIAVFWFRLRVCLIGWRWHRVWVWSCMDWSAWTGYWDDYDSDAEEAYIDGWCRE